MAKIHAQAVRTWLIQGEEHTRQGETVRFRRRGRAKQCVFMDKTVFQGAKGCMFADGTLDVRVWRGKRPRRTVERSVRSAKRGVFTHTTTRNDASSKT